MKRLFMVSRYALFGDAVEGLLGERSGLKAVGRKSDPEKAIDRMRELGPDVVVLDNDDPDSKLTPSVTRISGEAPSGLDYRLEFAGQHHLYLSGGAKEGERGRGSGASH